jgi:hypothetical protein
MHAEGQTWADVVNDLQGRQADLQALLAILERDFNAGPTPVPSPRAAPNVKPGLLKRLLEACPCLFNQVERPASAAAVVHMCELTLGTSIVSSNVHDAFLVQHPSKGPDYSYPPVIPALPGGSVMEMLCSEVLTNAGIPAMQVKSATTDELGWPDWEMPGHVLLNSGKMGSLKAFGDILIPCAPTNIVISVKTEAARERLLYSSNSIEGVGFGFFNKPSEFWTESRMRLYKRMGFTAIYLPEATHAAIVEKLGSNRTSDHAVNINGTPLYRPLSQFGGDMKRIVGKSSLLL